MRHVNYGAFCLTCGDYATQTDNFGQPTCKECETPNTPTQTAKRPETPPTPK